MDVFAVATDAIFADPNIGEDAIWRPGGLGGMAIRVVRRQPPAIAEFGPSRAIMPAVLIEARRSEAPDIAEGDFLEIADETFRIIAQPLLDGLGLVMTCEAARVYS